MNLFSRVLVVSFSSFVLFLSACANVGDDNIDNSIERLVIKESLIDRADLKEGTTFSYADVLEKATPAVVSVYTAKYQSVYSNRIPNGIPDLFRQFGFPMPEMYGEYEAPEKEGEQLKPYGAGSGVIMTEDGYIMTNHHVVLDQKGDPVDEIKIRLDDKREYVAELIGSDKKTDIAVLKIEVTSAISPITVANSDQIRVGDFVFAIGNPLEGNYSDSRNYICNNVIL